MTKPSRIVPVFALDESVDRNDLENALEASVQYQSSQRGVIRPLLAFAPMTEPANLDQWEPMQTLPQNLLLVSIERHIDARVLKALERAAPLLGPTVRAGAAASVHIDLGLPLADIYRQITVAEIAAFAETRDGKMTHRFSFCGAPPRSRSSIKSCALFPRSRSPFPGFLALMRALSRSSILIK